MKHKIPLALIGGLSIAGCGGPAVQSARFADNRVPASICQGPVTIRSAADVRSVAATCRSIDGDLRLFGTEVKNLDGLENLRELRYLVVVKNPKLENVRGLRGLVSARGVTFVDNPALENLAGLEGLSKLDAAVLLNNGVRSLQGLGNLRSVGELVVTGNPHLESVSGLATIGAARVLEVHGNGVPTSPTAAKSAPRPSQ